MQNSNTNLFKTKDNFTSPATNHDVLCVVVAVVLAILGLSPKLQNSNTKFSKSKTISPPQPQVVVPVILHVSSSLSLSVSFKNKHKQSCSGLQSKDSGWRGSRLCSFWAGVLVHSAMAAMAAVVVVVVVVKGTFCLF